MCLQDQRDALLGRVFGLAALCRSGLPAALPAAPAGSISALRGTAVVAEQLLGLLQRKAFLRESAAAALVELLGGLSTADMQQVSEVADWQAFFACCWFVLCSFPACVLLQRRANIGAVASEF